MSARVVVQTGLDRLVGARSSLVRGRRVGLLCHPAAVDQRLRHCSDCLLEAGARLVALFAPEHGIDGAAQDMVGVGSTQHPRLAVPVYSVYGNTLATLAPRPEWLRDLDLLVVDLQDIGSRYYTFAWTMVLAMRACAATRTPLLVLDRPNPLGGAVVEGPSIAPGFASFVGLHPLPVRHGLTLGELARLTRAELQLDVELEVLPLDGWRRTQRFAATGLPWVLPSPNMPTPETALVYPGACLLEGTNVSEGRGTTRPFELVGAPWIDGYRLAADLTRLALPGALWRPLGFVPSFHKHAQQLCGGVQLHVSDPESFAALRTGVALLLALWQQRPGACAWRTEPYEFVDDRPAIDLLAGGEWLRRGVSAGATLDQLTADWAEAERDFLRRRQPYLLYD
ncbi:MAG: DUF1343 domain-containing protein [Proteobacteria bacterium]|nr:DUF1343 domain-containing protein [Pseudomonadota bacterium]